MSEPGRDIPEPIKRSVRAAFNFCCPICGCPIVQYHHIINWNRVKKHEEDNIIPLCPMHHAQATNGIITQEYCHSLKKLGNKSPGIKHSILINSSDFTVKLGTWTFLQPSVMIAITDTPVLVVDRMKTSNLLLSAQFNTPDGKPVLQIKENELLINNPKIFSDITFISNVLTIKYNKKIVFLLEFSTEHFWIKKARFYYAQYSLIFDEDGFDIFNGLTHFKDSKVDCTMGPGCGIYLS